MENKRPKKQYVTYCKDKELQACSLPIANLRTHDVKVNKRNSEVEFGTKLCKKAKIHPVKQKGFLLSTYEYVIKYIMMVITYLTTWVNWSTQVKLPESTANFVNRATKVKSGIKSCQMLKKHYNNVNNECWYAYEYILM